MSRGGSLLDQLNPAARQYFPEGHNPVGDLSGYPAFGSASQRLGYEDRGRSPNGFRGCQLQGFPMNLCQFNCPHCAGVFQVDMSVAGQLVTCPLCTRLVTIPAGTTQPAVTEPTSYLGCPLCRGVFQVTAAMAGQQVACPVCNRLVTVPGLAQRPTQPHIPPAPQEVPSAVPPSQPVRQLPSPPSQLGVSGRPTTDISQPFRPVTGPAQSPDHPGPPDSYPYPPGTRPAEKASADSPRPQTGAGAQCGQTHSERPSVPDAAKVSPSGTASSEQDANDASLPSILDKLAPKVPAKTDSLSPPGTVPRGAPPGRHIPLPVGGRPGEVLQADAVNTPTENGGVTALREPVKVVGQGDEQRELHRLSSEEKAQRRFKQNVVMWVFGAVVLACAAYCLCKIGGG